MIYILCKPWLCRASALYVYLPDHIYQCINNLGCFAESIELNPKSKFSCWVTWYTPRIPTVLCTQTISNSSISKLNKTENSDTAIRFSLAHANARYDSILHLYTCERKVLPKRVGSSNFGNHNSPRAWSLLAELFPLSRIAILHDTQTRPIKQMFPFLSWLTKLNTFKKEAEDVDVNPWSMIASFC